MAYQVQYMKVEPLTDKSQEMRHESDLVVDVQSLQLFHQCCQKRLLDDFFIHVHSMYNVLELIVVQAD